MSIAVNPEILTWARRSAGFDVENTARKLGFGDSSKSTAAEKLAAMEAGEKQQRAMSDPRPSVFPSKLSPTFQSLDSTHMLTVTAAATDQQFKGLSPSGIAR